MKPRIVQAAAGAVALNRWRAHSFSVPVKRRVGAVPPAAPSAAPPRARRAARAAGFTMIEIALSLAIIGFALVAIIGILPYGLSVQRENTEETIINHDATVLLDGIANGQQGMDDLTNYVAAITNYQTIFSLDGNLAAVPNPIRVNCYTTTNSYMLTPGGGSTPLEFPLVNGDRIVGLLSTPKYVFVTTPQEGSFYVSNHVVAVVRAMTGLASDKFPQTNPDVREGAFTYRLTSEVVPGGYGLAYTNPVEVVNLNNSFYPDWTNYTAYTNEPAVDSADWISRSNNWRYARAVQQDVYDVRFLFRWPVSPQGVGSRRQVVRGMAAGPVALLPPLLQGTEYPTNFPQGLPYQLYFAQPNLF